jgi:hypothetical protein
LAAVAGMRGAVVCVRVLGIKRQPCLRLMPRWRLRRKVSRTHRTLRGRVGDPVRLTEKIPQPDAQPVANG